MDEVKHARKLAVPAAVLAALVVACLAIGTRAAPREPALTNSAAQVLGLKFNRDDLSYVLLDARNGDVISERWDNSDQPIAIGSLVKPFTALAYAERHRFRFPTHVCSTGMCWLPGGHGATGIVRATAVSCNAYFTHLAATLTPSEVAVTAQHYGLNGPVADATAEGMAGQHGMWRESPQALARAYAELLARRSQPGVREVVEGMALAAKQGTAAEVSKAVPQLWLLAKTGTAPCTHERSAAGDGFALVAWPAEAPRNLLLVRQHNHPGAQAAIIAGQMVRALEPQ